MTMLRNLSIRRVLLADAAVTGVGALVMLAGAPLLDELLDLPATLLAGAGAVLIPYVGYLVWLAGRTPVPRAGVGFSIAANAVWVVGCAVLLFGDVVDPSALGVAFLLLNAVAVLVFAELQVLAMRGERSQPARKTLSLEV